MENKPISEILEGGELYHHGILGMKWGIRRFQPYSLVPRKSGKGGKETGAAKKAGGKASSAKNVPVKSIVKKSRKQKSAEAKAEVQKKANTARERRESLQKAIRTGDVKTVYKRRAELTDKELEDFVKRVGKDKELRELVAAQTPSKKQKIKDIAKKLDEYNDVVQTGLKIYKTGVEIKDVLDKQHKDIKTAEKNAKVAEIVNDTSRLAELYENRKDYSKEAIDKAVNKYNSEQSLKKILDSQAESSKKGSDEKESKNAVDVDFDFDTSTSTKAADNKGMTVREIREDQEMRKKLGLPPREYKQRVNH